MDATREGGNVDATNRPRVSKAELIAMLDSVVDELDYALCTSHNQGNAQQLVYEARELIK